jgi:hypothetical protein
MIGLETRDTKGRWSNKAMKTPLVFLGGPSGAGKSTVASFLGEDLGLLFLEVDFWGTDGIDFHGLRTEWDTFWDDLNASQFAAAVLARARPLKLAGAVLSFPSNAIFTIPKMYAAQAAGIRTFIMYGSETHCLSAFLAREKPIGRCPQNTGRSSTQRFVAYTAARNTRPHASKRSRPMAHHGLGAKSLRR